MLHRLVISTSEGQGNARSAQEKSFRSDMNALYSISQYYNAMWNYNFYVYITTNPTKTALYIGITNNLERRLFEHFENKGRQDTFAGKNYCYNLVYYEHFSHINYAIDREKEIKKWRREKKEALINSFNPEWMFLNKELGD